MVLRTDSNDPVQNSTQSFWRTDLDSLDSHRTTEVLPESADILVIGAGYAGASTVYHLLEKTKKSGCKPRIVILEAREACSGATGRNGMIRQMRLHHTVKLRSCRRPFETRSFQSSGLAHRRVWHRGGRGSVGI